MPDLNLEDHADALGDPSLYFVHADGQARPLVVEHATGRPAFAFDPGSGVLEPYPAFTPAPEGGPAPGASAEAAPGRFEFGGVETPAPE